MDEDCKQHLFAIIKIIGGIFVIVFLVIIIFLIIVPNDTECSNVTFNDIFSNFNGTMVQFSLEQTTITFRKEMKILDEHDKSIGSYFEMVDGGSIKFRYKYINSKIGDSHIVGKIEKKPFLTVDRYFMERCDGSGSKYRLEQKVSNVDDIEYNLFKNNTLIGETSESNPLLCKSNIELINDNGTIAKLNRGCGLIDKWNVINYRNDLVDTYVIGFIGYITTLKEIE